MSTTRKRVQIFRVGPGTFFNNAVAVAVFGIFFQNYRGSGTSCGTERLGKIAKMNQMYTLDALSTKITLSADAEL